MFGLCVWLSTAVLAQTPAGISAAQARHSGSQYLSPQLLALQNDPARNPLSLFLERGQSLWSAQCSACHGDIASLTSSAAVFPRLGQGGLGLVNLEDQIAICQKRGATHDALGQSKASAVQEEDIVAISAVLHQTAKGQIIRTEAPQAQADKAQWQLHLDQGQKLYTSRMGRMNLACMHCHDQKVGAQMRADTISQGHPTGFPIYRMSWQTAGTVDRRLRACYSGVQAPVPTTGSIELRQLELYLKVRANGMALDGPSIRR